MPFCSWPLLMSETKRANASADTGAPLRRAESGLKSLGGKVSQAAEYSPDVGSPNDTGIPSTSKNSALLESVAAKDVLPFIVTPLRVIK
jgi:hypothetical protein